MHEPSPTAPLADGVTLRPVALALLTLALIALCVYLSVPFLPALTWAVALAIIAWPVHRWVDRRLPGRSLPAALSATLVAGLIFAAVAFVAYQLAREAASVANQAQEQRAETVVRDSLARTPATARAVEWMDRVGVDIDREARRLAAAHTQDLTGLLSGSLYAVVQFAVAVFLLFHLFRDPGRLLAGVRRLLPMTRAECDRVFGGFADSVHANLYAALVTSAIDAVTGGLVFWAVGLPSPVLWAVVLFVLSLMPMVGIFMVWPVAALYLGLTGQVGGAAAVVVWGLACGVLVDNLLYVRLAGPRMRLHQVPTLLAFLGGLAVFGASGMVLGPAILAVTVAVLEVWHRRAERADEADAPAAGRVREERAGQALVTPV